MAKTVTTCILVIRVYQRLVSPLLGDCCRFTPSCSEYTQEAINKFGACRGIYLGVKRLLRCHPFCKGGQDLVPEK